MLLVTLFRATPNRVTGNTMNKEAEGFVRAQLELYGRISRAYENLKKRASLKLRSV